YRRRGVRSGTFALDPQLLPGGWRQFVERLVGECIALGQQHAAVIPDDPRGEFLAGKCALELAQRLLPDDANFLALVLLEPFDLEPVNFLAAIVAGHPAPREHPRADRLAFDTARYP